MLDRQLKDPGYLKIYQQEKLILDATDLLDRALEEGRISRADFARMLDRSRSYVTQVLSGGRNLTLRSLADAMTVLGLEVKLSKQPLEYQKSWIEWEVNEPQVTEGKFEEPMPIQSIKGQAEECPAA